MLLAMPLLLLLAAFESGLALLVALWLRGRRAGTLGEVLHTRLAPRGARRAGIGLQLVALTAALVAAPSIGVFGLLLLLPLIAAWWLAPATEDQRCGLAGVQYGWETLRLEELEAWRLTGDHLRFRLRGLWVAVSLPSSEHPRMRALLEQACPAAESGFRD
jgi:hypothetical protein